MYLFVDIWLDFSCLAAADNLLENHVRILSTSFFPLDSSGVILHTVFLQWLQHPSHPSLLVNPRHSLRGHTGGILFNSKSIKRTLL
jgi:hypothetical protein